MTSHSPGFPLEDQQEDFLVAAVLPAVLPTDLPETKTRFIDLRPVTGSQNRPPLYSSVFAASMTIPSRLASPALL
jgi:hypothetical protein